MRIPTVHSTFAASPTYHRIISKCGVNICEYSVPRFGTPARLRRHLGAAHEAFIHALITMHRVCHDGPAAAAQCRSRADLDLPAHAVAAGRLQLPASADLLGLRRRSHRTLRPVGRRMDDAGADITLPAMGDFRHRQRPARKTTGGAMVSAVALRPMAQRQRVVACGSPRLVLQRFQSHRALLLRAELAFPTRIDLMSAKTGQQQCAGKSATTVMTSDRLTCSRCSHFSSSSSLPGDIWAAFPNPTAPQLSSSQAKASGGS